MTNIAIRGFKSGVPVFEDVIDGDTADLDTIAFEHAMKLGNDLHMIEIEFLDEPDPNQRFLRFGTDPGGMVAPIAVDLKDIVQ